jgi:hypothetical protein
MGSDKTTPPPRCGILRKHGMTGLERVTYPARPCVAKFGQGGHGGPSLQDRAVGLLRNADKV